MRLQPDPRLVERKEARLRASLARPTLDFVAELFFPGLLLISGGLDVAAAPGLELDPLSLEQVREPADRVGDLELLGQERLGVFERRHAAGLHLDLERCERLGGDALGRAAGGVVAQDGVEATGAVGIKPAVELALGVSERVGARAGCARLRS